MEILIIKLILALNLGIMADVDGYSVKKSTSKLISDLVGNFSSPPTQIGAFLCSDKANLVEILRVFSEKGLIFNEIGFPSVQQELFYLQSQRITLVLYLNCQQSAKLLKMANDTVLFASPHRWIMILNIEDENQKSHEKTLETYFDGLAVYPDSDVTVILHSANNKYTKLLSIYRIQQQSELLFEELGIWNEDAGFYLSNSRVNSRRRMDLRGKILKVKNPEEKYNYLDFNDKRVLAISRSNYIWISQMAYAMNSSISVVQTSTWGYMDKNGTWNGMTKSLKTNEVDIGTPMFLNPTKFKFLRYLPLFTSTTGRIIMREPPLSFVQNIFTFKSPSVFTGIGILMVLFFGLLIASTRLEWQRDAKKGDFLRPFPGLVDNFVVVAGIVCQQGFVIHPRSVSTRMTLLTSLLAIVFFFSAYSAHIMTLLQSTSSSVNSLEALLNSPIKCGMEDVVYFKMNMKYYMDPVKYPLINKFMTKKIEPKSSKSNWMNMTEGIKKVREGSFAFFGTVANAYHQVAATFEEAEKCDLREIKFVSFNYPHISTTLHSPYLELLRVNSIKIIEFGFKSRTDTRLYPKKPICADSAKFSSVGIRETCALFYFIVYGSTLAFVIFCAEIVGEKYFDRMLERFGWLNERKI